MKTNATEGVGLESRKVHRTQAPHQQLLYGLGRRRMIRACFEIH